MVASLVLVHGDSASLAFCLKEFRVVLVSNPPFGIGFA